ncbi:hypothetical protein TNCT_225371 [Trichonephila clavata]|uniref:Uncharacterized protein n=1 Tax=Trichonephila clavata TaxID=2740835 RepID=A0A8X6KY18_TRICU|nr:hypothetical protein TNCT_225371 [Trichonephila clavata]
MPFFGSFYSSAVLFLLIESATLTFLLFLCRQASRTQISAFTTLQAHAVPCLRYSSSTLGSLPSLLIRHTRCSTFATLQAHGSFVILQASLIAPNVWIPKLR